jgi:undecaprenyl-diphosphatase
VIALALAFAVHILIPAAGNAGLVVDTIASASWGWVAVALLMSAATYLVAALGMRAAVDRTAPLPQVTAAQVASTAALLFAPAGLGGLALNERFFQRRGLRDTEVVAGLMLNTVVTAAIHVSGVLVLTAALGFRFPQSVHAPGLTALQWTVAAGVVIGLAVWITAQRRRLLTPIVDMLRSVPTLIRDRRRVLRVGLAAWR